MKFEVWSEGYVATGERAGAKFHGTFEAETFREACILALGHFVDFDGNRLTLWGSEMFDNETDARRNFG